ncbi:GNAT family N-acetyltransferase [Bacteroides sp. 224]|uniref:GNAT family N-acetyltransferase n=1 Tax=Bacteroides sp. 224 TaxID=2302936 RepID=UPI0013D60F89|nr:GNAT family N-acetyltransferase [Bacteroides sp. 224]NDV65623.1 GNAT family N-acetyltransferase [Bacteroides sp. 224]
MINIHPIKTSDTEWYNYMEQLMVNAFPIEEYRDLQVLRNYTDTISEFFMNIIFSDDQPVGFISYWDLGSFYYVEHFAIDPSQRNGGYGQKLLALLKEELKQPIVLEVELPDEEMAQRRINFYKRQGFTFWDLEYFQPPYRTGYEPLPMRLMVNGNMNPDKDFESIRKRIHESVYGVKA